jgi:hypothetical protein
MTSPSQCPQCQARFPESLEQFGDNFVCLTCGQIQRIEGPPLILRSQAPLAPAPPADKDEDEWSTPQPLPPLDQLLTVGWQLFRGRMGLCIAAFVLSFVLNLVSQYPAWYADQQIKTQQLAAGPQVLWSLGLALATIGQLAFSTWLNIGYTQILLKVVRGQSAEMGDLFRGGAFFWRALSCLLILCLLIAGSLVLGLIPFEVLKAAFGWIAFAALPSCLIPAVVVALSFWPYLMVLIDRDPPDLQALRQAAVITFGNKRGLFGLFCLCGLLWVFGLMAAGVGLFVAVPYTGVVTTLAYDRITRLPRGRRSSRQNKKEVD